MQGLNGEKMHFLILFCLSVFIVALLGKFLL